MTTSAKRYVTGERSPATLAATARRLTDPLGAAGQRATGGRIARERGARRALAGATVTAFLAIIGAFLLDDATDPPAPAAEAQVIWAVDQDGTLQQVRVVEAEVAQARTRSS